MVRKRNKIDCRPLLVLALLWTPWQRLGLGLLAQRQADTGQCFLISPRGPSDPGGPSRQKRAPVLAVTADGMQAASASWDKTVKVWDLDTGLPVATFHCDAFARCCAFADDHHIVAGDEGGRVHFLVIEKGV